MVMDANHCLSKPLDLCAVREAEWSCAMCLTILVQELGRLCTSVLLRICTLDCMRQLCMMYGVAVPGLPNVSSVTPDQFC